MFNMIGLSFCLVILFTHTKGCEDGWEWWASKCYLFSMKFLVWEDARKYCENNGAHLLKVDNEEEHQFIRAKLSEMHLHYVWIGAKYSRLHHKHLWIDGSEMTVNGWAPGEPDGLQGCVDYLQKYNYLWNSHCDCASTKGRFICEKGCGKGWKMDDNHKCVLIPKPRSNLLESKIYCEEHGAILTINKKEEEKYICEKECDIGWEKFGNKCYRFSDQARGWDSAKSYCQDLQGSLVIVESQQEHEYIQRKISDADYVFAWIGARYNNEFAEHRWVDGSPLNFTSWAPGLPGNSTGCVDYLHKFDYMWNSHSGCKETKGPFICQKALKSHVNLSNDIIKENNLQNAWPEDDVSQTTDITPETTDATINYNDVFGGSNFCEEDESATITTAATTTEILITFLETNRKTETVGGGDLLPTVSGDKVPSLGGDIIPSIGGDIAPTIGEDSVHSTDTLPSIGEIPVPSLDKDVMPSIGGDIIPTIGEVTVPSIGGDSVNSTDTVPSIGEIPVPSIDKDAMPSIGGDIFSTIGVVSDSSSIETDTGVKKLAAKIQDSPSYSFACFPNNTIEVYSLPENSYCLAVQGTTTCTVSNLDTTSIKITGCSKDEPIILSHGTYQGIQSHKIQWGTSMEITCVEIPDSGVTHYISNSLAATMQIDSDTGVAISYTVTSSLSPTSCTVGDPVTWTISFPPEYTLKVTSCTGKPDTSNVGASSVQLISNDGCTINTELISSFQVRSPGNIAAVLTAFKFYSYDEILLSCDVIVCPSSGTGACATTCDDRRRSIRQRSQRSRRQSEDSFTTSVKDRLTVYDDIVSKGFNTGTPSIVLVLLSSLFEFVLKN